MVVGGTNSEWYQLFKYDTEKLNFYNVKDLKVLDVEGHRDEEGNKVVTAKSEKKQAFQQWKIVYADKAEAARTKGKNE